MSTTRSFVTKQLEFPTLYAKLTRLLDQDHLSVEEFLFLQTICQQAGYVLPRDDPPSSIQVTSDPPPQPTTLGQNFSLENDGRSPLEELCLMASKSDPVVQNEEAKLDPAPRIEEIEGLVHRTVTKYKKRVEQIDHGIGIEYSGCEHPQMLQKTTKMKVCDLAYLYSDPIVEFDCYGELKDFGMNLLNFNAEFQQIKDRINEHCVDFLICKKQATVSVLQEVVTAQPKILHISCHGKDDTEKNDILKSLDSNYTGISNSGNLCFEHHRDVGMLKMVKGKDIQAIVNTTKMDPQSNGIKLLVVSACYSSEIAEQIRSQLNIPVAIAIKKGNPIEDLASISFANLFYNQLLLGETIRQSYENAKQLLPQAEKYQHICCCRHKHLIDCKFSKDMKQFIEKMAKTKTGPKIKTMGQDNNHKMGCPISNRQTLYESKCNCNPDMKAHAQECLYFKRFHELFKHKDSEQDFKHLCCCREQSEVSHFEPEKFILLGEESSDIVIFDQMMAGSLEDSTSLNPERLISFPSEMWIEKGNLLSSDAKNTHLFSDFRLQKHILKGRNVNVYKVGTGFIIESNQQVMFAQGPKHLGIEKVVKRAVLYAFERHKILVGLYINVSECEPHKSYSKYILDKINNFCSLKVRPFSSNDRAYAQNIYSKLQTKEAYGNQKIVIIIKGAIAEKEGEFEGLSIILKILTTGKLPNSSSINVTKKCIVKIILLETYPLSLFGESTRLPLPPPFILAQHHQLCKQHLNSDYLLFNLREKDVNNQTSKGKFDQYGYFQKQFNSNNKYFKDLFQTNPDLTWIQALKFGARLKNYFKSLNKEGSLEIRNISNDQMQEFVKPKKMKSNERMIKKEGEMMICSKCREVTREGKEERQTNQLTSIADDIIESREEESKKEESDEEFYSLPLNFDFHQKIIEKLKTLEKLNSLQQVFTNFEGIRHISKPDKTLELTNDWIRFDEGWYFGQIKKGKRVPHGFGVFIHPEAGSVYEGYRKNGIRSGEFGRYCDKFGYRYEGAWKDNYPHGEVGYAWFCNGDQYQGEFSEKGQMHGKGELWISSENRLYIGEFENGKRQNEFRVITNVVAQDLVCPQWDKFFKQTNFKTIGKFSMYPHRDFHLYTFNDDQLVQNDNKIYIYWFKNIDTNCDMLFSNTEGYISKYELQNSREVFEHMMLNENPNQQQTYCMCEVSDINPTIMDMVKFYNDLLALSQITDQPSSLLLLMYQLHIVSYPNTNFFAKIKENEQLNQNAELKSQLSKLIDDSALIRVPLILNSSYNSFNLEINTDKIQKIYQNVLTTTKSHNIVEDIPRIQYEKGYQYLEEINQIYNIITLKKLETTKIGREKEANEQERARQIMGQSIIQWFKYSRRIQDKDYIIRNLSKIISKPTPDKDVLNQLLKQMNTEFQENQNQDQILQNQIQIETSLVKDVSLSFDQICYILGTFADVAGIDQVLTFLSLDQGITQTTEEDSSKTEDYNIMVQDQIDKYESVLGYRFKDIYKFEKYCLNNQESTVEFRKIINASLCMRSLQKQPILLLKMMEEEFFFNDPTIWVIIAIKCNYDTLINVSHPERELIKTFLWESQFSYENNRFVQLKLLYNKIKSSQQENNEIISENMNEIANRFLLTMIAIIADSEIKLENFLNEISNFASFIFISQFDENTQTQEEFKTEKDKEKFQEKDCRHLQQYIQINLLKYKKSTFDNNKKQPSWMEHNQWLIQEIRGTHSLDKDIELPFTKCLYNYFDEFDKKSICLHHDPFHTLNSAKVYTLEKIMSFTSEECRTQFNEKNFLVQVKYRFLNNTIKSQILHSKVICYLHMLSSDLGRKDLLQEFLIHIDQTMQQAIICPGSIPDIQSDSQIPLALQVYLLDLLITTNKDKSIETLFSQSPITQNEAIRWIKSQQISLKAEKKDKNEEKLISNNHGSDWVQYQINDNLVVKKPKLDQFGEHDFSTEETIKLNQKKIRAMIRQQQMLQIVFFIQNQNVNLHQVIITDNQHIILQDLIMTRESNESLEEHLNQFYQKLTLITENETMSFSEIDQILHIVLRQFIQSIFYMYTLNSKSKQFHGNYKMSRVYMKPDNTGYIDQGQCEAYTSHHYFLRTYNIATKHKVWVQKAQGYWQDRKKIKSLKYQSRQSETSLTFEYDLKNAFSQDDLLKLESDQIIEKFKSNIVKQIKIGMSMKADSQKRKAFTKYINEETELMKVLQQLLNSSIFTNIVQLGEMLQMNKALCLEFMKSLRAFNHPYYSSPFWKDFKPIVDDIIQNPASCDKQLVSIYWQDNWFRKELQVLEEQESGLPTWVKQIRQLFKESQPNQDFEVEIYEQQSQEDIENVICAMLYPFKSFKEQIICSELQNFKNLHQHLCLLLIDQVKQSYYSELINKQQK